MNQKRHNWQLPSQPTQTVVYDLCEMVGESGWGKALVVDVAPGEQVTFNEASNYLVVVTDGQVIVGKKELRQEMFGQFPLGYLTITNLDSAQSARLHVMTSAKPGQRPVRIKTWRIEEVELEDRPQGIRLRSLWKHARRLPQTVGYEWFVLSADVPLHTHRYSKKSQDGSYAIVVTVRGQATFEVAENEGPSESIALSAGVVTTASPTDRHGFKTESPETVTGASLQGRSRIKKKMYQF